MMKAVMGVLLAAVSASARAESVEDVLARVRAARGEQRLPGGSAYHLKGGGTFLGEPATVEAWFDDTGRSILETRAGIVNTNGFDGEHTWMLDLGGEARLTHLGERESALFGAGVISGWWFEGASGMRFTLDDSSSDGQSVVLRFAHDEGRATGSVWIERDSWRATRWALSLGTRDMEWELSGALEVAGRIFPARVLARSLSGSVTTTEFTSGAAERVEATRFGMPASAAAAPKFDVSAPAELEIKKAPTGHLLVKASFDGGEPGWFIFDTGAGMNCIDQGVITARGYENVGEVPAMGVGGSVLSPLVRPASLRVGRLIMERPLCVGLDLKDISVYMGEPLMGIVGYNAIACSIVEIDTETPTVRLFDPASYRLERGEWTPMMVYERHPCFEGTIEGHAGVLKLDTGAAGAGGLITIHAEASERFALLEGRETSETRLGGVGGFVAAKKGTLSVVEFGGTRHENVEATFALEKKGAFSDPYIAANVGAKMIAGYTLVLDYSSGRAALVGRK